MTNWTNLIDLEHETQYFEELLERDAPDEFVKAEYDRLCMCYFGFTKEELNGQVPQIVMDDFENWYFEEVINLGQRHGFDFEEKKGDKQVTRFFDGGYVVGQSAYFAEMLIAKECGFFPSTPDELATVKLERQAKEFQAELLRQRQRPKQDARERAEVFGEGSPKLRAGMITAPVGKGKDGRSRTVSVEVIPSRRVPLRKRY